MRFDETCEDNTISEVVIEVNDLSWMHRVHLVIVISQPLEQDSLWHRVDVGLAHHRLNQIVWWRNTG
jgi:hypothetical protein